MKHRLQEIVFCITIAVCFHWSVRAGPRPRDARENILGNAIYKVFRREANPDVKQVSVERSLLRFPREPFNPCLKGVETLLVADGLSVNVHVCYNTTNLGCLPVNGKYLCQKIIAMYTDSAGKVGAYASGCQCQKT